jgi:hypothetical protein
MAEPVSILDQDAELSEGLAHLYALLEQGDVEGARALIGELEAKWPDSSRVQHFARVLAPPQARRRKGEQGRSLHRERAWLRVHAREYSGCWLALQGDRLIAADPDLDVVLQAVEQSTEGVDPLVYFQPENPQ